MEEFPSGQRGQTVNLLSTISVVRIHLPPPFEVNFAFESKVFLFYIEIYYRNEENKLVKFIFKSESELQTKRLGTIIAKKLFKGSIVCLEGDLGAGKTQITKSICAELGVSDYVTSPTFTIVNEYVGDVKINHFDAYRIEDISELEEIGFDEYIYGDAISIIEWANLIDEILPKERLWIKIDKNDFYNIDSRVIILEGNGNEYENVVKEIENELTCN
jgi:tRNA threonylcarbamoyladenosine biosynthesis protein TsaE